jgi:hypothetical protein
MQSMIRRPGAAGQVRSPSHFLKQPDGYDPSRDLGDAKLAEGWYLIQGHVVKSGERDTAQTEGGIWIVVKNDELVPSMSKVIAKSAAGCEKAEVGEYVSNPTYGGNENDHRKPYPVVRFRGDDAGLFLVHEDNVHMVLPAAKVEEASDGECKPE